LGLSLQQNQEYQGSGRWRWAVWLDGPDEELDSVDHVTYILDSTFHNPVRSVSDRATNFRLETYSWGNFTMHARIDYRDGRENILDHDLILLYPNGEPTLA
jgi:transcription initiation factor IIF auxiliary subunit